MKLHTPPIPNRDAQQRPLVDRQPRHRRPQIRALVLAEEIGRAQGVAHISQYRVTFVPPVHPNATAEAAKIDPGAGVVSSPRAEGPDAAVTV